MRTLLIAILVTGLGAQLGASVKASPAGVITAVMGKVTLYSHVHAGDKGAKESSTDLELNQPVFVGDRLKTGANGRASLVLTDGTQLKVNYNSEITLHAKDAKGHASARGVASIQILLGDLWARVTKKNSTLEFETPAAVAAVKGTEPTFNVAPDGTTCIQLASGKVALSNDQPGGATLNPDEQICVNKGQAISQSMVQPWKSGAGWAASFGQASKAAVTVVYKTRSGAEKTAVLNFGSGAGVSGTAQ
jgi:hypothetical protein